MENNQPLFDKLMQLSEDQGKMVKKLMSRVKEQMVLIDEKDVLLLKQTALLAEQRELIESLLARN